MRFRTSAAPAIAASLGLAFAAAPTAAVAPIEAEVYLDGFTKPLGFVQHPNDPDVQFIVEQGGLIHAVENGVVTGVFLDVSTRIGTDADERGLLGLALSPEYPADPVFYINYTNDLHDTVIARYQHTAGDSLQGDFDTEEILLMIDQPFSNHNGGHMAFGPDGMLYISSGDGGLFNDPNEEAQDTTNLLGTILRLDVSGGPGSGYSAPSGNPFAEVSGCADGCDEIWSYGLRNTWKFSFDVGPFGTGAMVLADVGQDAREEVNYEPAGADGRNYGWDCMEGTICGNTSDAGCACGAPSLTAPIHETPHPTGGSITGGYVYRGSLMPKNRGRYFFGDFLTRRAWSLGLTIDQNGEATVADVEEHTDELTGGGAAWVNISCFGRDAAGELYAADYSTGTIYRLRGVFSPADVNCDGSVDGADLGLLLQAWGPGQGGAVTDLNNDGQVDGADLGLLLQSWAPASP